MKPKTTDWVLVAHTGDGADVALCAHATLAVIEEAHKRLASLMPDYGPWHARRGKDVVALPRP